MFYREIHPIIAFKKTFTGAKNFKMQ